MSELKVGDLVCPKPVKEPRIIATEIEGILCRVKFINKETKICLVEEGDDSEYSWWIGNNQLMKVKLKQNNHV